MQFLRQSTAATIKLGPFVDDGDGKTVEDALTITQADIRLTKNGGDFAQTNNTAGAAHDEGGWYGVPLDTTDAGTVGRLLVYVEEAGALPVWREFMVLPANVYDSLVAGSDALQVHANEITAGLITATAIADAAIDAATFAVGAITAAAIAVAAIDDDALAADTDTYQAKAWLFDDDGGTTDRYVCVWHQNGMPITSGITSPTIQVIKVADGSDLVGSTSMTQIAALGMYRYDEATNRIVNGVAYVAKVQATIGGSTRTWYQPVGRDS